MMSIRPGVPHGPHLSGDDVTQGMRAAAARTFDTLGAAVARALAKVQPPECLNFFAHAGYGFN